MSKTKKKSWYILNMDDGFWYWVEDQPNENAAIEEYLQELFDSNNEYLVTLQVHPVSKYAEFEVSNKKTSKMVKAIKRLN